MFVASKLVTMLEWEPMSTHAEIVSTAMMDLKFIVRGGRCSLLMVLMLMVRSPKEVIPVTLLFMKGEHLVLLSWCIYKPF